MLSKQHVKQHFRTKGIEHPAGSCIREGQRVAIVHGTPEEQSLGLVLQPYLGIFEALRQNDP